MSIPFSARVTYPVLLYPEVLSFVDVKPDEDISAVINIIAPGKQPLALLSVNAQNEIKCDVSTEVVESRLVLTLSMKGQNILEINGKYVEFHFEIGDSLDHVSIKIPVCARRNEAQ